MRFLVSAALAAFVVLVPARADIMVSKPVVNLGIGDRPSSLHGHIMNHGDTTVRLVAAESPSFDHIELHTHEMKDGMMKMIKVDGYDVPAGQGLMLKAGAEHLMLFGRTGDTTETVKVTLIFADGRRVAVSAPTRARKKSGHHGHHGHKGH